MKTSSIAAALLVLLGTLAGCGSDPDSAGPAASPTAVPSAAPSDPPTMLEPNLPTPTEPGGITTAPAPEPSLPSSEVDPQLAGLWEAELSFLVDASIPAPERAARIVDGRDLVSTIRDVDARLTSDGAEFDVTSTEVRDTLGIADVTLTSAGRPFGAVLGVRFMFVGDAWRLTRPGACLLAGVVQAFCPGG